LSAGFQVVEHHLGERVFAVQAVHVSGQSVGLRPVANRIEAGIRAELPVRPSVVVAPRAEVKLFGPALSRIPAPEFEQQEPAKRACSAGVAAWPLRALSKMPAASFSSQKSAKVQFNP